MTYRCMECGAEAMCSPEVEDLKRSARALLERLCDAAHEYNDLRIPAVLIEDCQDWLRAHPEPATSCPECGMTVQHKLQCSRRCEPMPATTAECCGNSQRANPCKNCPLLTTTPEERAVLKECEKLSESELLAMTSDDYYAPEYAHDLGQAIIAWKAAKEAK